MVTDPETAKEIAKAAKAAAETTGKAIDAGRDAGGFIAKYIAGPLEQGMGIFEDKLKYMRWERQLRLMRRSEQLTIELGYGAPSRAIPMKVAIPLFQGASIEDDDTMQDRWINLLINAAYARNEQQVQRYHVDMLAQMSPLEAQILDKVYALPFEEAKEKGIIASQLPTNASVLGGGWPWEPETSVCLALANLKRLGCIALPDTAAEDFFAIVLPTRLGRDFVAACRCPEQNFAA
jgi:hypothetical protein